METYQYNVVISIGIDRSQFSSGKEAAKTELRQWEQEVINSQARMTQARRQSANDERRIMQEQVEVNARTIAERQQARIADFKAQQDLYNQELQSRARNLEKIKTLEVESYAQRLALHQSFVNSLNRQQQTAEQNAVARSATAGQGTVTGAFTPSIIPTAPTQTGLINQATNLQANQQALLRQFAGNQLNDAARNIQNLTGQNILLNETVQQGAKHWGMWGQAFKGAFVGAVAGMSFSLIISGMSSIVDKMFELIKTSVQLAANFEQTRSALTVFTGSATLADRELAALDETARNTVGLSLPSARDGYQQLRSLNFEAGLSRKLLAGLGKERLLSGADEQSVQRVITNLVQLSSGSSRASQDVKEMIHAIPRLAQEFQQAYGTLDFKQIGEMFKKDPEGALKKLANQMEQTKNISGGFNDALLKMNDEIQRIEEKAGKPLMQTLTSDILLLTRAIHDSTSTFIGWGVEIEHTYTGLKKIIGLASQYDFGLPTMGFRPPSTEANNIGENIWEGIWKPSWWTIANKFGDSGRLQTATEIDNGVEQRLAERAQLSLKRQMQAERDRQEQLDRLKGEMQTRQSVVKDSFRLTQAGLDSVLRYTPSQDMAYAKASGELKSQQLDAEYSIAKAHLAKMLELNKSNDKELFAANQEFARETAKYNADKVENELKTQRQIAEIDKRIQDERRTANLEFLTIQTEQNKNAYDVIVKDTDRYLAETDSIATSAFNRLSASATTYYDKAIESNRKALELQLQDRTLSDEKRQNLINANHNTEIKLEQEKTDALYDINQKYFARQVQIANQTSQFLQTQASNDLSKLKSLQTVFERGLFFGQTSLTNLSKAFGIKAGATLSGGIELFQKGNLSVYDVQAKALDERHKKEQENLGLEIKLNERLQKIEQERLLSNARTSLNNTDVRIANAQREVDRNPDSEYWKDSLKFWQTEKQTTLDTINQMEKGLIRGESAEARRLDNARELLKQKKEELGVTQDLEQTDLKRTSDIRELNKIYQDILDGKYKAVLIDNQEITLAQERQALAVDYQTKILTLNEDKLLTLYRQNEAQKVYNELTQRELDAVTSIDKSRILLADQAVYHKNQADAKVLDFFASQKGVTDIISDAKIGVITSAYTQLDNVIRSLTKSFGFASDAVSQFLSSLLKLALNKIFMRLFGLDANGNAVSFGTLPNGGVYGGGGGANGQGGDFVSLARQFFSGGASASSFNPQRLLGYGAGSLSTEATLDPALMLRGGSSYSASGMFTNSADLLGAGFNGGGGAGGAGGGLASLGAGSLGGFGAVLPFLGASLGTKLGGTSTLGKILGGLGGFAGGVAALGLTGGLTGLLGIGGALTATAIALPLAPLLIAGAIILKRNAQRRNDEKTRDKAMVDAFAQLDDLIKKVQTDQLDGTSALTQADQIRASYLDSMNKLKDDKTRRIALADVSRLDAKISLLKTEAEKQVRRQDRLTQLVPTFASGGNVSPIKYNPTGYQTGINNIGWFPNANTFAMFNEKGNEYIFNAETTRNIGVRELDAINASKGMSYLEMRKRLSPQGMLTGGEVNNVPNVSAFTANSGSATPNNSSAQPIHVHLTLNVGLAEKDFVELTANHIQGEGSQQILDSLVTLNDNQGTNQFLQQIASFVKNKK